jgi:hypothetical protein
MASVESEILTVLSVLVTIASNVASLEAGGTTAPIKIGSNWYTISEVSAPGTVPVV